MNLSLRAMVLLLAAPAMADDLESLHVVNFNFDLKPGWMLQLHTRTRTFESISAFNQFRVGPILLWQAKPRFTVLSGYYYIDQNTRVIHEPYDLHRVWGGGQYRLVQGENWSLDGRSVLERFVSTSIPDYWRWRNRAMLNKTTRFGLPYLSGEALVQQGIWYGRYTAGMQWKLGKRVLVGAGYEYRDAARGPGSHIIATFFQWTVDSHTPPHVD